MTPLGLVTLGLTLVLIDIRIGDVDVVPDLLGWIACFIGFGQLAPRLHRWQQARQISYVSAGLQVLLIFAAIGQVQLSPVASSVFTVIDLILGIAIVAAICTALIETLSETAPTPDTKPTGPVREALLIRAIYLALAGILVALVVIALVTGAVFASGGLLFLLLPLFGTYIWLLTLIFRLRSHPELQAA